MTTRESIAENATYNQDTLDNKKLLTSCIDAGSHHSSHTEHLQRTVYNQGAGNEVVSVLDFQEIGR